MAKSTLMDSGSKQSPTPFLLHFFNIKDVVNRQAKPEVCYAKTPSRHAAFAMQKTAKTGGDGLGFDPCSNIVDFVSID